MQFNRCKSLLAACAAALAAAGTVSAEEPFSFDQAFGRLPKNVLPIDYTIDIVPDLKSLAIAGTESVLLDFRSATATIQFNSLNETLREVTLDGKPVKAVASDDDKQLTTVTLAAPAPAGRHTLKFEYHGKIEQQPHGLFVQHYVDPKGVKGLLLSTQMEATDARRMFPCWDEPAFRATFGLAVTVPAAWATVGNMPVARRTVHGPLATTSFARSPKMPSYLIEFTAGDLAQLQAVADGTRFGVWALRGQEQGGAAALANAQQILSDYNDFFGIRYPLPKLDSIAISGGFGGAMENWGAITYNESYLLLTPASTVADRQNVYAVQAHEMAHQWFGDLVTMGWWDNTWLNESFASWMAAKQTDRRNPDWRWWLDQDGDKESAMRADSVVSSHAIQQHVSDELLVNNTFDPEITYSKGQAILRMFEAYLGPDTFRDALRQYMQAHAYSNATGADLWIALGAASKQDMRAIAAGWTEQPGFPLLDAVAHCEADGARAVRLSQRRFLRNGADTAASGWRVPLQIRSGAHGTVQTALLATDGQSVAAGRCGEPLSINADAIGYYRVRYDEPTLAVNTSQFAMLPPGDRVALLDDQWALALAGIAPLRDYLALVRAMGSGLVPRAWEQIANALETVEYAERGAPGHAAFTAFARSILRPAFDQIGWDARATESASVRRLRRTLIADLGIWGDEPVIAESRKRFGAFVADHRTLAPDDQGAVLAVVAHHADAATFEQLHALARSTKDQSELPRYFYALTQVADPELAARAAKIALSDEIPPQQNYLPRGLVFELAHDHQQLAWGTFTANAERLMAADTSFAPLIIAWYVPRVFWNGVPLGEIEAWARAHIPAQNGPDLEHGMGSARLLLREKATLVAEADAYLKP
jgi:aminopeptidase N